MQSARHANTCFLLEKIQTSNKFSQTTEIFTSHRVQKPRYSHVYIYENLQKENVVAKLNIHKSWYVKIVTIWVKFANLSFFSLQNMRLSSCMLNNPQLDILAKIFYDLAQRDQKSVIYGSIILRLFEFCYSSHLILIAWNQ